RPAEPVAQIEQHEAPIQPTAMPYDLVLDLAVTGGAAAFWLTFELLKSDLATPCRWCDRDAQGNSTLNEFDLAIRTAFKWRDTLSTVFSFGLAPAAGIAVGAAIAGHDHRLNEFPVDLLVVAQSAMLAMDLNQIAKFTFARERPYVHFKTPAERAATRSSDDNL